MKKMRHIVLVALACVSMIPGIGVKAATTTFAGSISITDPKAGTFRSGSMTLAWSWRAGTYVKSTSTVDVLTTINGVTWTALATNVPIRRGAVVIETKNFIDNVYAFRVQVRGTTYKATVSPVVLDNTGPSVRIMKPAPTEVIVDDETLFSERLIIGTFSVSSESSDALSGVAGIRWALDEEEICDTDCTYNFSSRPGVRTLSVTATDRAGNSTTVSVPVRILPGPSAIQQPPSPGPIPTDPPSPEPLPSDTPTPGPLPSDLPTPSPSDVPTPGPVPTPSTDPLPIPTI